MVYWFRVGSALLRIASHLLVGLLIVACAFPFFSNASKRHAIRWWARRVLAIAGIRVRVIASPDDTTVAGRTIADVIRPDGVGGIGAMLVMNHISWADIHVVHAVRPARFIAKAEISAWPILGYLTKRAGTIFIERGRRHAVRDVSHRARVMLDGGDLVALFPEGTTTSGDRLLPFHANLMQAAIEASAPIVVAGLRYVDRNGRRTTAASYVGEMNLVQSLMRIVRSGPVTAEIHLIRILDGGSGTRHALAGRARALIARTLDLADDESDRIEGLSTVIVASDVDAIIRVAATRGREPETALDPRDELL